MKQNKGKTQWPAAKVSAEEESAKFSLIWAPPDQKQSLRAKEVNICSVMRSKENCCFYHACIKYCFPKTNNTA